MLQKVDLKHIGVVDVLLNMLRRHKLVCNLACDPTQIEFSLSRASPTRKSQVGDMVSLFPYSEDGDATAEVTKVIASGGYGGIYGFVHSESSLPN
jgi:hypothetical protein